MHLWLWCRSRADRPLHDVITAISPELHSCYLWPFSPSPVNQRGELVIFPGVLYNVVRPFAGLTYSAVDAPNAFRCGVMFWIKRLRQDPIKHGEKCQSWVICVSWCSTVS